MNIKFIGAIQDVTGSKTLLDLPMGQILIDCGLYQGTSDVEKKNMDELPFEPKKIKAIILTHAHLDHSGFIPRLVKLGFRGSIFCTHPTMKLALIIMSDSANLMELEANHSKNRVPFYEMKDVMVATSLFKTKKLNESFEVCGVKVTLLSAGHILGAASVKIEGEKTVIFSGDLGRHDDPLIYSPEACPKSDVVVIESTYGDRIRSSYIQEDLHAFLNKIKNDSCVGIIASFAVARAQLLITLITDYYNKHPEYKIPFMIDGPMMTEANTIYREYAHETKCPDELQHALRDVQVIEHLRQWNSVKKKMGPLLIISSSGMLTGGRIWRHLENSQDDETACLFLPGFQGIGTAGRQLAEGIRHIISPEGKHIRWQGEVITSSAFSSHADQNELIDWLKNIDKKTEIYINHGEDLSKKAFKKKLISLGYSNVFIAGT
jgi:metallo-beta-lactamase family protein